jgi:hypothetical protein
MSSFTTELDVTPISETGWRLNKPFRYLVGDYEHPTDVIEVPYKFITDFASVPQALWWIFPPWGKYGKAAVVHDWCYSTKWKTKKEADAVFYEAMGVLGVPQWKRTLLYFAVHFFGKGVY